MAVSSVDPLSTTRTSSTQSGMAANTFPIDSCSLYAGIMTATSVSCRIRYNPFLRQRACSPASVFEPIPDQQQPNRHEFHPYDPAVKQFCLIPQVEKKPQI